MFPQAVYFPIRTLYLTLKIEQRERFKAGELVDRRSSSPGQQVGHSNMHSAALSMILIYLFTVVDHSRADPCSWSNSS